MLFRRRNKVDVDALTGDREPQGEWEFPDAPEGVSPSDNQSYVDQRTDDCPNCGDKLRKIPGSKTKCPHCGKNVYVRIDYRVNARRCIGEFELPDIEAAAETIYMDKDEFRSWTSLRDRVQQSLTADLGRDGTPAETRWAMLSEECRQGIREEDTGQIFSASLRMMEISMRDMDFKTSIAMMGRCTTILSDDGLEELPLYTDVLTKALSAGITPQTLQAVFAQAYYEVAGFLDEPASLEVLWETYFQSATRGKAEA